MSKVHGIFSWLRQRRKNKTPLEALRSTILLDPIWYRDSYLDLRGTPIDPAEHYLNHGASEGRNPHPLFDTNWYLSRTPDAATAGINPLVHYLSRESFAGSHPHPLFDVDFYMANAHGFESTRLDPLTHYLTIGWKHGIRPGKFFEPTWYLEQYPDVRAAGFEPLSHYMQRGWREDRRPSPSFDPITYRERHHLPRDTNPLLHSRVLDEKPATQRLSSNQNTDHLLTSEVSAKEPYLPSVNRKFRLVREVHYEVWRAPKSLKGKNVCLLVAYAPDGYIPKSTNYFIQSLKHQSLTVIVIVASRNSGRPHADAEIVCDGLISRDNFGYDFASWALGLQILPSIWQAKTIIFANDSIFGPLYRPSFTMLMERIEASQADYVALTQSWQVRHHYQSYFFVLKERAIHHPGVKHFWTSLEIVQDRDQAILRYEVPMLDRIKNLGLETEVIFSLGNRDFERDANPTLDHWRDLIKSGFPFIKVQVLRDDIIGVDKANWDHDIQIDADIEKAIDERLDSGAEKSRKTSIVRQSK